MCTGKVTVLLLLGRLFDGRLLASWFITLFRTPTFTLFSCPWSFHLTNKLATGAPVTLAASLG